MTGVNQPEWVPLVRAALGRGIENYKLAAETITMAMAADPTLTQIIIADFIGHKPPYVSVLLKWHRSGCPPEGPFAAEIAARRAKIKQDISTSKLPEDDQPWLLGIDGSPTDAPPQTQARAIRHVMTATAACHALSEALDGLSREKMLLACEWDPDQNRVALNTLKAALQKAIVLGDVALGTVLEAVRTPRKLDAA